MTTVGPPETARSALALVLVATGLLHCASLPDRLPRIERLEQRIALELDRQRKLLGNLPSGGLPSRTQVDSRGWGQAHYEWMRIEGPFNEVDRPEIVAGLTTWLQDSAITRLAIVRAERVDWIDAPWKANDAMQELPLAALVAAVTAAPADFRGAEMDLWLEVSGQRHAVTARHELDHRLVVLLPDPEPVLEPLERTTPEELIERFGVGPIENGAARWTPDELGVLSRGLSLLRPAERIAIQGLPFRREESSVSDRRASFALYRSEGDQRSIEVYDGAFRNDPFAFIGDLEAPRRVSLRVVVHEIGHAIARFEGWQLSVAVGGRYAALKELRDEFNRLGRSFPEREAPRFERMKRGIRELNDSWNEARSRLESAASASRALAGYHAATRGRAPSEYGKRNLGEAFAEAFALYVLDPRALERIEPAALEFFESGAHLPAAEN